MGIKCFMIEPTDRERFFLRRYVSSSDSDPAAKCPGKYGYHNGHTLIGEVPAIFSERDGCKYVDCAAMEKRDSISRDDPRWPVKCDDCPYVFQPEGAWQHFYESIWLDATGKEYTLRDEVPGMMWDAYWMGDYAKGTDGKCLIVILPDGYRWMIDGPASNCTLPDDRGPYGQAHRCWVRHGTPPDITVDKDGKTCAAGAGSIMSRRSYHGFLRSGEFT